MGGLFGRPFVSVTYCPLFCYIRYMTKTTWIAVIVMFLIFGGVLAFSTKLAEYDSPTPHPATSTTTATKPTPVVTKIPYGKVNLKIGQTATFSGLSLKLLRVTEDSRCAQGVQCIWAGTLKVEVEIVSGMGKSTQVIEVGKSITTEAEMISFVSAVPYPKAGTAILSTEYIATFDVTLRKPSSVSQGACYVGGCSGEVCSDQPNVASNCIYKPEFACYKKTSTCERQTTGACGWTKNEALTMCLSGSLQN